MTFISYPNIYATSDNKEFRIQIVGTPGDEFFRDQSHFAYRLFHLDQQVWEWVPDDNSSDKRHLADYPHEAWVHDAGWVVVRTHDWFFGGLLVLSPTGQVVLQRYHRSLDEQDDPGFLDDEPEDYMGFTSIGPLWSRSSLQYFFEQDQRPFWAIRTWWGTRVVIDLSRGTFIDPAQLDESLLRAHEVSIIRRTLRENLTRLEELQDEIRIEGQESEFWRLAWKVLPAAYHAGWLRCAEVIPELRRLEGIKASGGSYSGDFPYSTVQTFPCCQVAKSALLRLQHEPAWQSQYEFLLASNSTNTGTESEEVAFQFPNIVADRKVEVLIPGLTQQEALLRIGAPDFIDREEWEYDFPTPDGGYTARVSWNKSYLKSSQIDEDEVAAVKEPLRIAKVDLLEPQWMLITMRDHDMT